VWDLRCVSCALAVIGAVGSAAAAAGSRAPVGDPCTGVSPPNSCVPLLYTRPPTPTRPPRRVPCVSARVVALEASRARKSAALTEMKALLAASAQQVESGKQQIQQLSTMLAKASSGGRR
jgi:hypothetical protein